MVNIFEIETALEVTVETNGREDLSIFNLEQGWVDKTFITSKMKY